MHIRFGPSGNSPSFYEQGYKRTKEQPAWLDAQGLDALEYSFGRGVRIKPETAEEIGEQARLYDVQLSVHAPYYINLASPDPQRIQSSLGHFIKTAQAAKWMDAKRIVFHPGSTGKQERRQAFLCIVESLQTVIRKLDEQGFGDIALCPETMGKIVQIGDLDETLALCDLDNRLIPCFDFGHLHARAIGRFGSLDDYRQALDKLENAVGMDRAKRLHIHFSRIEYTKGGEKRHWNYEDTQFGPSFEPLAEELFARRYAPVVICESKTHIAEDALLYKRIYQDIERKQCK